MLELSIAEASDLLRRREISPVDLTNACLARIEQLNPRLNAFITVMHDSALAEAREAEHEIAAGRWRGPLHGIPIGLKDLIDTAGTKTTCGSALFAERVPTEDAEVVQRLKAAGTVLIGKQNMQEFAWGGTSASSYYGPVRNPWDVERIAGGSSGGSAAAVGAGSLLRIGGFEADVRSRFCTRSVPVVDVAGPCWAVVSQRSRHGAVASGDWRC